MNFPHFANFGSFTRIDRSYDRSAERIVSRETFCHKSLQRLPNRSSTDLKLIGEFSLDEPSAWRQRPVNDLFLDRTIDHVGTRSRLLCAGGPL